MRHNDVLELLGRCPCPCHPTNRPSGDQPSGCWCRSPTVLIDGLALHHNDRLWFGRCTCPHHIGGSDCCCRQPTSADLRAALSRLEERDRERRWRPGQRPGVDVTHRLGRG
jgi:hypothetical protein